MKIKVKTTNGVHLVPLNNLLYIEANTPYSYVYLLSGTKIFCVDNLKMFDNKLNAFGFFRIHKSYLINVNRVVRVTKNGESNVHMEGGEKLKVSRSKKNDFCQYLKNFHV